MDTEYVPQLSWEATFLDALAQLKNIKRSVAAAGVTTGAYYSRRDKSEAFASLCDTVLGRTGPGKSSKPARNSVDAPAPNQWKRAFLDALAETSSVTASANCARISTREVYKTRRDHEDFARDWHTALIEGYEHLEMDLLSLGDAMGLDGPESPVAAIGRGDAEPVIAPVEKPGLGAQPLVPVHARRQTLANGDVSLTWIRRARGVWTWDSAIETPINESFERYVVGIGPPDAPVASWELSEPLIILGAATVAANSGQVVWVRQISNTQASHPLFLTIL